MFDYPLTHYQRTGWANGADKVIMAVIGLAGVLLVCWLLSWI